MLPDRSMVSFAHAQRLAIVTAVAIGLIVAGAGWWTIHSINHTNRIACQFIKKDADTRLEQAKNSAALVVEQRKFVAAVRTSIRLTSAVLGLRSTTKPEQPGTSIFFGYLEGEVALLEAQARVSAAAADAATKNIALSRDLATEARRLAKTLDC